MTPDPAPPPSGPAASSPAPAAPGAGSGSGAVSGADGAPRGIPRPPGPGPGPALPGHAGAGGALPGPGGVVRGLPGPSVKGGGREVPARPPGGGGAFPGSPLPPVLSLLPVPQFRLFPVPPLLPVPPVPSVPRSPGPPASPGSPGSRAVGGAVPRPTRRPPPRPVPSRSHGEPPAVRGPHRHGAERQRGGGLRRAQQVSGPPGPPGPRSRAQAALSRSESPVNRGQNVHFQRSGPVRPARVSRCPPPGTSPLGCGAHPRRGYGGPGPAAGRGLPVSGRDRPSSSSHPSSGRVRGGLPGAASSAPERGERLIEQQTGRAGGWRRRRRGRERGGGG